jgi:predicted transposase/invertase (TIGR01784 family)
MKNVKTLSPKLDVVFQALFGEVGNESITKGFLETILERKIDSIDLSRNPILRREFKDEKLGVLDIIAKLDENEICNIELQIVDKKNIIERILYYWSRLYSRQIKSGEDYKILQKAIVILITDFKIENLEELDYHSRWKIMEDKQGKKIILTQKLEIDIIELPKIIGKEKEQDNLLDWLYFLENPKSERVTKKMKENENLKEAVKKLDNLSEDEKMQRIADLRQKAIMDEKAIYEKGLEIGIEKGIQRGMEKGIEKGIMEGSQKEKIEIAKKMLELKIDKETIAEATGLTEQEIEKILN